MAAYQSTAGDVIALDNEKAGALVMSTSLSRIGDVSTDPVGMFARVDAFRTVAEAIASNIAAVPFDLYRRDPANGRQKLHEEDHPVAAALEAPVPRGTQFRFVEALQMDFVLNDRWAFLISRGVDGGLEFIRLPGRWISFAVDGFRRITHVVVYMGSEKKYIPAEHCCFDVGYDPDPSGDETSGYSISHTLATAASELVNGAMFRAAVLAGGPKVPMYVKRPLLAPDWIKNGGRERFVETFKAYSAEKAGQTPVLEDGMELAAAPQLDQNDVQYQATRLAAQIEFAIAMHYPPELIGYRAGNHANLGALREQLYVDVLGGRITAFRQALNACLRAAGLLEPGHYIEENLAVRLASSPEAQASVLQTQVGAPIKTVNEARRLLNLPPVAGGDELIVPLNVIRGGLASPTDTAPKTLSRTPAFKALTQGESFKAAADPMRDQFAGDLARAFARQADRVRSVLGSASSPGPLSDAFDLGLEDAELASVLYPHSYAIATVGAAAVLAKFNPEREGYADEVLQPWLLKAAQRTATAINTATFAKLSGILFEGDWSANVDVLFDRLVKSDAGVWAQTVATSSSSFGAADAAKVSGLKQKAWRSSEGSSRHAHLEGETVGISDVFSNGLRWPGDPAGDPSDTSSCHCRAEYSADAPA